MPKSHGRHEREEEDTHIDTHDRVEKSFVQKGERDLSRKEKDGVEKSSE